MSNIIKIYEENNALLTGHFLLSSGKHSDRYLQSELVMMNPSAAANAVAPLVKMLNEIQFSLVVSPAIGGIRFGYELARQLGKRSIFTERVNGAMCLRRGFSVEVGEKVIIAEDVVTTGKSTKECTAAVQENGAVAVAVVSMIDRTGGAKIFDIPFLSLGAVNIEIWEPQDCPLCKAGSTPIKPGSRM
ncbi:MAG: orotate phosphoribosyltransferase [Deferribacteraceae bacterium]|jgi:orotate phosphoribosyltransferase|nr:orotate phosphoribosyltransferase [Deferribacteraceae bacterium]